MKEIPRLFLVQPYFVCRKEVKTGWTKILSDIAIYTKKKKSLRPFEDGDNKTKNLVDSGKTLAIIRDYLFPEQARLHSLEA